MQVRFYVTDERKRICGWDALDSRRRRVPGPQSGYGRDLPHDLAQYVIEASTGFANGFWGLVARGATFKSVNRRVTKPGRALIVQHRAEIAESEALAGCHLAAWKAGDKTPTTHALDAARLQWRALELGSAIVFDWPSPQGRVKSLANAAAD
jgi:hypothetical protein